MYFLCSRTHLTDVIHPSLLWVGVYLIFLICMYNLQRKPVTLCSPNLPEKPWLWFCFSRGSNEMRCIIKAYPATTPHTSASVPALLDRDLSRSSLVRRPQNQGCFEPKTFACSRRTVASTAILDPGGHLGGSKHVVPRRPMTDGMATRGESTRTAAHSSGQMNTKTRLLSLGYIRQHLQGNSKSQTCLRVATRSRWTIYEGRCVFSSSAPSPWERAT